MIIPAEFAAKYEANRPYVQRVADIVHNVVLNFAETSGYAFLGRIKGCESLSEKIETGRFARWSELDDHYACALVIPTLEDEPGVLNFLQSQFETTKLSQRGKTIKDPRVFRFDATRFVGRVGQRAGVSSDSLLSLVCFEVQIRTAFEHAWSVTTHKLSYKGPGIDWRRERLTAQLKAAVEQLDLMVAGYSALTDRIHPEAFPELATKQEVELLFRAAFDTGRIPPESEPASWTRFCENIMNLIRAAAGGRRNPPEKLIRGLIACWTAALAPSCPPYPRSLSLLQFALGEAVGQGLIPLELGSYYPPVTSGLADFYPATNALRNHFDSKS
jgi:ppGpp synthetase/RelA/SpoT-type nucleotidyltranferase